MTEAIAAVQSKGMSIREACTTFNVPRATLGRRLIGKNKIAANYKKHLRRYKCTFDENFEKQLKD